MSGRNTLAHRVLYRCLIDCASKLMQFFDYVILNNIELSSTIQVFYLYNERFLLVQAELVFCL